MSLPNTPDPCSQCDLKNTCRSPHIETRTHLPDDKNENPKTILVVGEAPGGTEDVKGVPFVGESGKVLDELLIRTELADHYIIVFSNAVNCRPPGNRTPTRKEIRRCRPWLLSTIHDVNPDLILALGVPAVLSVSDFKITSISKGRGNPFKFENKIPVVCTYHPAALLYDRDHTPDVLDDLDMVKKLLAGDPPNYRIKRGLKIPRLDLNENVCIDVETTGLHVKNDELVSWAFCLDGNTATYLPIHKGKQFTQDVRALWDFRGTLIGQNLPFDLSFLSINSGLDIRDARFSLFDTLIGFSITHPEARSSSLKVTGPLFTGITYEEDKAVLDKVRAGLAAEITASKLGHYNGIDTIITYRLHNKCKTWVKRKNQRDLFSFIMDLSKVIVDMKVNGVRVDTERVKVEAKRLRWRTRFLHQHIKEKYTIDPTSANQVRNHVYGTDQGCLGMTATQFTEKTGNPSMQADALSELQDPTGFIPIYQEFKHTQKFVATYWQKLERSIDDKGFVYPSYHLARSVYGGAVTGRLTVTEPSFQTFPGDILKRILTSRFGSDGVILKADLSQIELRVAAILSGDSHMIQEFVEDRDLHKATASAIFKVPLEEVTQDQRQVAKTCNFAIIYRCSPNALVREVRTKTGLIISPGKARGYIESFYKKYPSIKSWQNGIIKEVKRNYMIQTLTGRVRHFLNIEDQHKGHDAEAQAINFPIQSLASDITNMGILNAWYNLHSRYANLLFPIYDAVLVDVLRSHIEDVTKILKSAMESPVILLRFGVGELPVPLKVDIEVFNKD